MNRRALLVVGHGTKSRDGVAEFARLVERVQARLPQTDVQGGFLELAPPPIQDAVNRLVEAGHRSIDVVPLVLVAAGHSKGDIPAALKREELRHPGLSFRYGRPLGPHPDLLAVAEQRLEAVLPREQWADAAVVLVGRGATDPDANAEVAKTARLLQEGRTIGTVETAFISLAEPSVPAGLDRARRLGHRTVVVLPWFLFAGVLPDRITAQATAWASEHPDVDVRLAGLIGPSDELARVVVERWTEVDGGDLRMNCDTCAYRVALPGFEAKVGAPQTPHDHPDDPAHPHSHDDHPRPRTTTRTTTPADVEDLRHPVRHPLRHHGDAELAPGLLDLAVNVRGDAPPAWLRGRLERALDRLAAYPDPTGARRAAARRHDRSEDEVLLTAGAAEAFVLLARVLRPSRAVVVHPGFTEPEAALRAAGHDVERLVLEPPYVLDVDDVPDGADLVVVGNPTNPTGVVHEQLDRLCREGRTVVVDEAFADAVPGEPHSLAGRSDLPGLVVVRSLTKTWALAGLRVGYLLAPAELRARLQDAQPLWAVSTLGLVALETCLAPGPVRTRLARRRGRRGRARAAAAGAGGGRRRGVARQPRPVPAVPRPRPAGRARAAARARRRRAPRRHVPRADRRALAHRRARAGGDRAAGQRPADHADGDEPFHRVKACVKLAVSA